MAKLYFKYGVMGSSKTAQALITKFNYEANGSKVLFIKPSTDTRDGENIVKSRIGLSSEAMILAPNIVKVKVVVGIVFVTIVLAKNYSLLKMKQKQNLQS